MLRCSKQFGPNVSNTVFSIEQWIIPESVQETGFEHEDSIPYVILKGQRRQGQKEAFLFTVAELQHKYKAQVEI